MLHRKNAKKPGVWRREDILSLCDKASLRRGDRGRKGQWFADVARVNLRQFGCSANSSCKKQKNTPRKGVFLFGAEKRICAFSGAPRWTIINCPFCLMRKRSSLFARQNACSRSRLPPLKSSSKLGIQTKKRTPRRCSFFVGAEKRI